MKRLTTARMLAALVGCLLLLTSAGLADSHARIVRVSYLQGPVDINRGQGMSFERAILNMPVVEGSQIWTHGEGAAEIEFEDGSTVRLTPDSRMEFTGLSLRDSGARVTTLNLTEGTAYVDVPHWTKENNSDEFTLLFPNRSLRLNHAVHMRVEISGGRALLSVIKGELNLPVQDREVTAKKNETLSLDLGDANQYSLLSNFVSGTYDGWDKERAKLRDDYLSKSQGGYQYGFADLSFYGSSSPMAGCAYGWRPNGVSYNWDPFASGAWTWYPGAGYTFVSYNPWGWMPYRYGSWNWVSSAGWTWCAPLGPWNTWNNWNTVPTILIAPPNYVRPHAPLTIASGNGGTIWVGKGGPGEREGQLLGNTFTGRGPGRGRGVGPVATGGSTVQITSSRGQAANPFEGLRSNPRGNAPGNVPNPATSAGPSGARWQAPPSRSDGGRWNQGGGARGYTPSSGGGGASPHYSAPSAPSPSFHSESPRMSAPSSSGAAAPSSPAATAARGKQ